MNTKDAAEKMLETGLFYAPIELAREFGCALANGERCIKNILANDAYEVKQTKEPTPRYKMIAINGRKKTIAKLQSDALSFARPSLLVGG